MIGLISQFEVVVVTLVTNHLELVDAVNLTVGTIGPRPQCNELQADSIVEALLIDDILQRVVHTCLATLYKHLHILVDDTNAIPTLGNSFLPKGNFLCQAIIVGRLASLM